MFDIHSVMTELAKIRPIFHSEADFQFALAWQIREMIPDIQIRLEFPLQEEMYLDIWIPNQQIAIELKYKTKKLVAAYPSESIILKEQGAQNHGRYDFLEDVERVESAKLGFAIILTNDPSYWKKDSVRKKSNHYNFRIHEGRELSGELKWKYPEKGAAKNREKPINLSSLYNLLWRDYSEIPSTRLGKQQQFGVGNHLQFRYLAVAVGE